MLCLGACSEPLLSRPFPKRYKTKSTASAHILTRQIHICATTVPIQTTAFQELEQAGVSNLSKERLSALANTCIQVVRECGLVNRPLAFRAPVGSKTARATIALFSGRGNCIKWMANVTGIPTRYERQHHHQLAFKKRLPPWGNGTCAVLGLQRVLDLGALRGFVGSPCGPEGGTFWLDFT